jgi:hypothetical protein
MKTIVKENDMCPREYDCDNCILRNTLDCPLEGAESEEVYESE